MAKSKKKTKVTARGAKKRRGKGESMTGAKANQVEVRHAIGQGDLHLPEPNDYQHHKKSLLGAIDKQRTATSLVRTARKNALAAGVDPDAILEANRIVRANDPKGTANKLNQLAFALGQEGFSIAITVHDTLAGDQMDLVYRRYYGDGKGGKALENEYPVGSDLAAQAARAWRHGMASNMNVSPEDSDKACEEDEDGVQHNLPPPPDMSHANGATAH